MQVRENILLSSGRVIGHQRQENGSQLATPLTGNYEMTSDEWVEYCAIINLKEKSCGK
jgi:hypothetical protein